MNFKYLKMNFKYLKMISKYLKMVITRAVRNFRDEIFMHENFGGKNFISSLKISFSSRKFHFMHENFIFIPENFMPMIFSCMKSFVRAGAGEKVASDLGVSGGFHRTLPISALVITG